MKRKDKIITLIISAGVWVVLGIYYAIQFGEYLSELHYQKIQENTKQHNENLGIKE